MLIRQAPFPEKRAETPNHKSRPTPQINGQIKGIDWKLKSTKKKRRNCVRASVHARRGWNSRRKRWNLARNGGRLRGNHKATFRGSLVRWRGMEEREKMTGLRPMRKRRPVTRIAYAIRPTLHFLLLVQNGTNIESSVLGMVFKGEARAILRMKVRKFFK